MTRHTIKVLTWLSLACALPLACTRTCAADAATVTGADFGFPPALLAQYQKYAYGLRHHDRAAVLSLLTPGFTCTQGGRTLSHRLSLARAPWFLDMGMAFPGSQLTVRKFFVTPGRATALVEEALPGSRRDGHTYGVVGITLVYDWTHHWLLTPQGWRLNNVTRGF